jgi:hypothetical protein
MKDTIYREDAIKSMAKAIWHYPNELYPCLNSYEHAHDLAEQGLKFLSSAEKKTGRWLKAMEGNAYRDKCNRCLKTYPNAYGYNFCPNCGSKMEGKNETT